MNTKIILELGCNHQGDISIAKQMIDDAKKLNVYGIKLQKRCLELLPDEIKNMKRDLKNSFGETYYEHRKALEFTKEQIKELKEYTESKGLNFSVSVFDIESAKEMIDCRVRNIKIPSQYFSLQSINVFLMAKKYQHKLFLAHSSGMHTYKEIISNKFFNNFFDVFYYCRSIYPLKKIDQADIGQAVKLFSLLKKEYAGYSSHDYQGDFISSFIVMGAKWIERHYTLDKTMKGSDHGTVSSDYKEMKKIIERIEHAERLLECKNESAIIDPEEIKNRAFYMGGK